MLVLARTAVRKAACGKREGHGKEQNQAILDAAAKKQEKTLALFCAGLTTSARSAGSFEGENGAFLRV